MDQRMRYRCVTLHTYMWGLLPPGDLCIHCFDLCPFADWLGCEPDYTKTTEQIYTNL